MLPSLSGLSLHDEEPTGVAGGITKASDDRNAFKAQRELAEAWKAAEKEEAEKARLQEMARRAAAEVDRQERAPGYPWRLMEARARERNEAAARLAAEQERDQAQQNLQALDGVREQQQSVLDAQQRKLNEQSRALEEGEKAQEVLASRVKNAEARAEAAQRERLYEEAEKDKAEEAGLVRAQRDALLPDDPAPLPAPQSPRDAAMAADNGAAPMEMEEDPDALPPYRGDTSLLRPSTSDRIEDIEELRRHLLTVSFPDPTVANPDLDQVLPMGFDRLMEFAFVERGTEQNGNNRDASPAAVEKTMLERREKAWRDFTAARDRVLNDDDEMRRWKRQQKLMRPLKISLEQIRWNTEEYLLENFRDFADKKTGTEDAALQYLNNPRNYPAIKAGLYKAMQEQHRSDGQTIFVRTEKVQAVYEAVLDFCQADLKYEVTLARRRTWAALYAFMEEEMLKLWPEGEPAPWKRPPPDEGEPVSTPEALWKHAIGKARKLPCFPTDRGKKFARVQVLMEEQVTQNIQWQYPYYNAYDLSRDDGIFGSDFKFVISKGPTMSLVAKRGDQLNRVYHIQHVHVPWEWMKAFLQEKATNLVRGLGNFCGTRFLVDEAYEKEKKAHDEKKNQDVPEALQTLPDSRTRRRAPLSMAEQRRLESSLSSRGYDEASRGAQMTMGTMVPNNRSISTGPMGIDKLRPYGSLVPKSYEFYDPYIEDKEEGWRPPDANWQPPGDWRPDIQAHRRRTFLLLHKKYYAYKEHQEIAQDFITALEASEEALYFQAWKERELVGELLDPNGCLRDTPKRTAFTFSLTSGFSVAPHDDSGSALEHIVFTYPAHTELPRGHNPMFVASGVIMMLPGPVGRGPPGYKIDVDNLRACLCTVPGHNVNHGSMPTWTAEFYQKAVQARKRSELTLPKHFKCGSALITKVVSHLVAQRVDSQGNLTEFTDCKGVIDKLNPRYMNADDNNLPVSKLIQLLYQGNTPYRGDEDESKNDPPDTLGKVWSFDVRSQWLASYPKNRRNDAKDKMLDAYRLAYRLTPQQFDELKEQEKQREEEEREEEEQEEERERQREEEERRREEEEEEERRRREEEEEDNDGGRDGGGNDDDDDDNEDGGGGGGNAPEPEPEPEEEEMDGYAAMAGNDDNGGGDAPESEDGQGDPMEDDGSGEAPPPLDRVSSDDSDDPYYLVPLNQRPITPTPPAQAGPSAVPMDVEGDGATTPHPRGNSNQPDSGGMPVASRDNSEVNYTDDEGGGTVRSPTLKELHAEASSSSTRRSKRPDRLGDFATHDDLVEINGRKVNDPISYIKEDLDHPWDMALRVQKKEERKEMLKVFEGKRDLAEQRFQLDTKDKTAEQAFVLAQEEVQAVRKSMEVARRKLREYDAQHAP